MDSGKMASPKSLPKLADDSINPEAYGNQRIEANNYKLDVGMFLSIHDHISYGSQASLRKLLLMLIMCDWQSNQTGKSKLLLRPNFNLSSQIIIYYIFQGKNIKLIWH